VVSLCISSSGEGHNHPHGAASATTAFSSKKRSVHDADAVGREFNKNGRKNQDLKISAKESREIFEPLVMIEDACSSSSFLPDGLDSSDSDGELANYGEGRIQFRSSQPKTIVSPCFLHRVKLVMKRNCRLPMIVTIIS
jgi:hypothetical protein